MSGLRARRTAVAVGAPLAILVVTTLLASPAAASTSPTAMITAVGLLDSHTNQPSRKQEALSISPAPGDVLALAIETKFPGTAAFTASGVNGGGVATWTRASAYLTRDAFHGQELWWGVVTQPGANTITVDYTTASTSASPTSATSVSVQEFTASSGPSTTWSVDETGQADTGEKSTAPTYPTLTPTAKPEVLFRLPRSPRLGRCWAHPRCRVPDRRPGQPECLRGVGVLDHHTPGVCREGTALLLDRHAVPRDHVAGAGHG